MWNTRKQVELEFRVEAIELKYVKLLQKFELFRENYDIMSKELKQLKSIPVPKTLTVSERIQQELKYMREDKMVREALDNEEYAGTDAMDLDVLNGSM